MTKRTPRRFNSIAEFHRLRGLPKPDHPLISVINLEDMKDHAHAEPLNVVFDFYSIALKRNFGATFRYGQQEYHANIDTFSQNIIVSQIEVLLNYADRFYHRQFITRKISNGKVLSRLETVLADYFNSDSLVQHGLPTVQYVAEALHVSPNYLSGMLKVQTGQSTQQHIHHALISLAKEKLSTTDLRVNEIAYELGFEHSQSFSKFFKNKTTVSPLEFRRSFR